MQRLDIDHDPARARTPPGELYGDAEWYARVREHVLLPAWHVFPGALPTAPGSLVPWTLLAGCLDEPLLWTRDDAGRLRCVSNACTHRGAVLVDHACSARGIRCPYHGRRFALDGRFVSMPGFEGVPDFPGPDDDLRRLEHATLGPLGFVSLAPDCPLTDLLDPVRERVGWLPIERLASAPASLEDYSVDASFLLYCDNYLEGFHIPFVHPGLARALQFDEYETRLLPHGSLQIASARDAEDAFELPAGHPDGGRRVAAWYFFLFPTTMLNVYPWGLSLNVILPQGPTATRVLFLSWVWDTSRRSRGAGADLGTVEREDEAIVRRVQHGVRSRLYPRGRYSPSQELGVHHFHRMLAARLNRQATRPAPA